MYSASWGIGGQTQQGVIVLTGIETARLTDSVNLATCVFNIIDTNAIQASFTLTADYIKVTNADDLEGNITYQVYPVDIIKSVVLKENHTHTPGAAATCTTAQICTECSAVLTAALGHNYSSAWTTDKAATCKEAGSKSHHCTRCNEKADITVIDKTAHTPGVAATCTTAQICTVCNQTVNSALGHNYSTEWTVDKAATADTEGQKSHHCTRCDAKTDITVIPKVVEEILLKTGTEFTTDD